MKFDVLQKKHRFVITAWLSIIFAAMHAQAHLYSSNQNTYFLHGLSDGGLGHLSRDWMANTADPFPVFSALVSFTYSDLHPVLFYVYYVLVLCLVAYSLMDIGAKTWLIDRSFVSYVLYALAITAVASPSVSDKVQDLLAVDLEVLLFQGLAGQYLLGPVFQPSVFGALLMVSVCLFLRDRPFWAVALLGATISVHPSYMITAASLTLAYMIVTWREEKRYWKPICLGAYSALLATPVLVLTLHEFASTSAEATYEAQRILVDYRISDHAKAEDWFDTVAVLKIAMLVFALWLHRRKKVFVVVLAPFVVGAILALIQVATKNDFLALLFPWRVSVFLVPLSSALIMASAVQFLSSRIQWMNRAGRGWFERSLVGVAWVALLVGSVNFMKKLNPIAEKEYQALIEHVSREAGGEDVYVIPASWENFRIGAGVPVFVDHKTHPYKDVEVLEWYARRQLLDEIYVGSHEQCDKLKFAAETYAATKIIFKSEDPFPDCPMLTRTFANGGYEVHDIRGDSQ
jgi:hypothetical protein